MNTKDAIQFALTLSNGAVLGAIDEAKDAPTVFPTPNGGCHPLWVLGHLTLIEGTIPAILYGEPNPVAAWHSYFGEGSQPIADAATYPSFDTVRQQYQELRDHNLIILKSLSDADLDKPTFAPPAGREREFATFGSSFLVLALHQTMHRSHVTDSIRAGKSVVHARTPSPMADGHAVR
jgi:hypothetical protein